MRIKEIISLFGAALLPFLVVAQQPVTLLKGNVGPALNGQKITVMYSSMKKFVLDSARVKDGTVTFQLKHADGQAVSLSTGTAVPMDNIRIYMAGPEVTFSTKDSLKNASISGHPHSVDFARMSKPVEQVMKQRFALMRQLNELPAEEKKGPAAEALNARMRDLQKKERSLTFQAIDGNPKSYIALLMLKNMAAGTISYDEMMPHFLKLSKELRDTPEGKALEEKILLVKNLKSGNAANDFESITPEGRKLKLSDIYPKAKFTFVDFWASWCAPCRAENPNVVKAYHTYKDKGLTILSVSLDTKGDLWKEAIQKDGMPWLHVSQLKGFDEPAAVLYGIKMIPQNVLIDAKGKIVATNLRGYALEDKLKELMN